MYKVIIADDEAIIRKGLRELVDWENLGLNLTAEACDGAEAFELIKDLTPHILITDIKMPEMDGISLVKNIKESGINIKIIIISAHSDYEFLKEAILLGVESYLLKPIDNDELTSLLSDVVKKLTKEIPYNIQKKGTGAVRTVTSYIEEHYYERITLKMMADHLGMNTSYLGQLFKRETGEAFADYINYYRIEKAKELLLDPRYKVYEVAGKVGFTDYNYFLKIFKKITGISPKEIKLQ